MTPSDENDVLHLYPQSKVSSEGEPGIDIPYHPFAEMSP